MDGKNPRLFSVFFWQRDKYGQWTWRQNDVLSRRTYDLAGVTEEIKKEARYIRNYGPDFFMAMRYY